MAGTKAGGLKAAATNKLKHGENFYAKIGRKGGSNSSNGGFAVPIWCECSTITGDHFIRQCAGAKGGAISRRGKDKKIRVRHEG